MKQKTDFHPSMNAELRKAAQEAIDAVAHLQSVMQKQRSALKKYRDSPNFLSLNFGLLYRAWEDEDGTLTGRHITLAAPSDTMRFAIAFLEGSIESTTDMEAMMDVMMDDYKPENN